MGIEGEGRKGGRERGRGGRERGRGGRERERGGREGTPSLHSYRGVVLSFLSALCT